MSPFAPRPHTGTPATVRHALLWRFAHEEERQAVARVGDLLHRYLVETSQRGPEPRAGGSSETRQELRAASADLLDCAHDLATVAEDLRRGRLAPDDADLAHEAGTWAQEAAALAQRIHETAAPPPA